MFIFYTNLFIKKEYAGQVYGPFIFIRPKFKGDKGLLEHEKVHRKQFFQTLGLHGILYALSKSYRYEAEIEAYRVQLAYCDDKQASAEYFSHFIASKYGISVSAKKAKADLLEGL